MGIRNEISKDNEWWISKHAYLEALHYAYRYGEWKDELEVLAGSELKSPAIDDMPHGSGGNSNPTEERAIRCAELESKIIQIETTAYEADPVIAKWLLKGVTDESATYNYLRNMLGLPCGHRYYYDKRRKFYFLLSRKLDKEGHSDP